MGMPRAKHRGMDAEPASRGRTKAVDDHVGVRAERIEDGGRIRRSQVEGDAALVAVEELEVDVSAVRERQRPHPVAAARVLDLDDVGAEVRQEERRVRAGEKARHVEHTHAVKRSHGSAGDDQREARKDRKADRSLASSEPVEGCVLRGLRVPMP